VLVFRDRQITLWGADESTTHHRMELVAVIEALRWLDGPHQVRVRTDSRYVLDGVPTLARWRRRKQHRDLWEQLCVETQRHQIVWEWVKGHSGHMPNEIVDRLATMARRLGEKNA
jgi:ribonuclease HI